MVRQPNRQADIKTGRWIDRQRERGEIKRDRGRKRDL